MPPPEELLPVLVADLADDESKDVLEAAAATGGRVYVPLAFAPVSASVHVLEAKLPSVGAPLLFLAEPLGPPTRDGFPLRIRTFGASTQKPSTVPPANGVVRGKGVVSAPPTLSASHTRDLSHVGPMPRDRDEDPLVGRALAGGKLKIEALIGRGGVGAVYKAIHRELKIPVAVKCLHESFQHDIDFCRRFYAEALAASRLDHPNLTRVIDFGQEPDGLLYLAMEYLDGVELRTVLEEARVFPTQRALEIAVQVCAAMSHAHARGVVHRDLKPENIMLVAGHDDDGEPVEMVKVCDFGIAQHRAIQGSSDGTVAGTPEYMSPEQCRGEELDARSDVYALGVILYELATGQVPFMGDKPLAVMQRQQKSVPLPMSRIRPEVEPRLEPIVQKALQKDPRYRQQTMRELRADLRELLSGDASPPPASVSSTSLAAAQPYPSSARMPAVPPPLPAKKPPPPAPAPQQPDWLERGGAYAPPSRAGADLPPPQGQEVRRATSNVQSAMVLDDVADQLQVDAAGWMTRFARTPDPRAFAQIAQRLEPAIRALAARGDASTMWTVSSALHAIASEGSQAAGSRAQIAGRVVRVFEDPTLLGVVGEAALVAGDGQRDFGRRLLVNAGVGGAYGLYAARVKLAAHPAVRPAFVALLKDFGVKAWPVVRAALEKILNARGPEGETNRATAELAEDLLLCVPFVGDEAAGHLVVKYLRASSPGPVRAATAAIAKLWGERAKPLFVGMLQAKDDVVRIAGIAGLRQLDAIDEHVVPRLHAILIRRVETSEESRAAAALALAYATPSAHTPAISLLAAIVRGPVGAPASMPRLPTGPAMAPVRIPTTQVRIAEAAAGTEDSVVHAAARSLLVVGGSAYRTVLADRAERAGEPLRSQLRKLLMAEGS